MNAITKTEWNAPAPASAEEKNLIETLRNSLYPGAKMESVRMVLDYCHHARLNPMLKPVHIVPMNVKKAGTRDDYEWRDVVMPGVGHYRTQADRSGVYMGKSEPKFGDDITKKVGNVEITFPKSCTITVFKMVSGQKCEFTATELWMENYATAGRDKNEPNAMWKKRPYGQLAKVAEAQALRMAFPELIGGTNTAEEMEGKVLEDASEPIVVVASEKPKALGKPRAEAQLDAFSGAANTKEPVMKQGGGRVDEKPPQKFDPETGEVLDGEVLTNDDYPTIPDAALNDWEVDGKWISGIKWFMSNLPETFPASRQAFVDRHREMLAAASKHAKYGPELAGLLKDNGVKL